MDFNQYCKKFKNNNNYLLYQNSNESLLSLAKFNQLANFLIQNNCTYIIQDPTKETFEGVKVPKDVRISNNEINAFNDFEHYLRYKKSLNILENQKF